METLFSQLDRDWDVLTPRPGTAAALADACEAAGVASPEQLVPAVRGATPEAADLVLAGLARDASSGSPAGYGMTSRGSPGSDPSPRSPPPRPG